MTPPPISTAGEVDSSWTIASLEASILGGPSTADMKAGSETQIMTLDGTVTLVRTEMAGRAGRKPIAAAIEGLAIKAI